MSGLDWKSNDGIEVMDYDKGGSMGVWLDIKINTKFEDK